MGWFTAVTLYLLIWWVMLFAMLPLWVTPTEPGELGHEVGAPRHPHIGRKLALNSVVAGALWLAVYLLIRSPYLSFRGS